MKKLTYFIRERGLSELGRVVAHHLKWSKFVFESLNIWILQKKIDKSHYLLIYLNALGGSDEFGEFRSPRVSLTLAGQGEQFDERLQVADLERLKITQITVTTVFLGPLQKKTFQFYVLWKLLTDLFTIFLHITLFFNYVKNIEIWILTDYLRNYR